MKTLEAPFLDELADIYDAENRRPKTFPNLAISATHKELRAALKSHLEETEEHVREVEKAYRLFNKPARGKKHEAIEGLLKEGDEIASNNEESPAISGQRAGGRRPRNPWVPRCSRSTIETRAHPP